MAKRKIDIIRLNSIDSTNTYLRTLAKSGACEGTAVIASEQTAGRGRHGKTFFSPRDTGLYMSILVRPDLGVEDACFLTGMTAVALARAIDSVFGVSSKIKWVNDIYISEKKVAGILCEGSFDYERDKTDFVVVGIGINLDDPFGGFPDEIKSIAASLGDKSKKEVLMQAVLDCFFALYDLLPSRDFLKEYNARSCLIGHRVETSGGISGTAIDIDSECRLVIKTDNGELKMLSSGEVSVKFAKQLNSLNL